MKTLEDLKETIVQTIDPDELIERLDLGTEDLVEYLSELIYQRSDRFEDLLEDEETEYE